MSLDEICPNRLRFFQHASSRAARRLLKPRPIDKDNDKQEAFWVLTKLINKFVKNFNNVSKPFGRFAYSKGQPGTKATIANGSFS